MDNSKDIFLKTINLQKSGRCPAGVHWWGIYKYEALGLDYKKDAWRAGEKISKIYADFYEKFKPDWFHLHIGTPKYFKDSGIVAREGKNFLVIDPGYRDLKKEDKYFSVNSSDDEEIVDFPDYLLGSRSSKPKVDLTSRNKIDDYIKKYIRMSFEEIEKMGYTDHVKIISKNYCDKVFIAVHIPSAVCEIFDPTTGYIGFEKGLLSFYDQPEGMQYLLEKAYEAQLEWAKAFADAGAHAFIISESFISPDIANPEIYRKFLKGVHKDYFAEVKNMGLIPICQFWGDINPIIDDLTEINLEALMVEESKKGFDIDVVKIREKIGGRLCIFGNLDSINLLNSGIQEDIKKEIFRQSQGARFNFIAANGSPITPGTPQENVRCLINTAKEIKWD